MSGRPAVFFDRDGTLIKIIERPNFTKKLTAPFCLSELEFMPDARGVVEAVRRLNYLRVMITNQPDVALGYLRPDTWQIIHDRVVSHLKLDDVFMCRHRSQDNCPLKKPSPLMLLAAADKWGIDLAQSYMVGDSDKDIEAGRRAGCRTILIRRHYNSGVVADHTVFSLADILSIIERRLPE